MKQCTCCGSPKLYAKGLCRACYARNLRNGTTDNLALRRTARKIAREAEEKRQKAAARAEKYHPTSERGKALNELYCVGATLQELGEIEGVSRERVRQLLAK
jgi:DNA-binding CsgD family transcriptional regulator